MWLHLGYGFPLQFDLFGPTMCQRLGPSQYLVIFPFFIFKVKYNLQREPQTLSNHHLDPLTNYYQQQQVCMGVCAKSLSHVGLFATLWTVPGSSVYGTVRARILEGVAMPSSRGSSQPRDSTQGLNRSFLCLLHWQTGSLPLAAAGKSQQQVYPPLNVITILTSTCVDLFLYLL